MVLGGFGGRELILMAAIALLLAATGRLASLQPAPSIAGGGDRTDDASSRAYLDRLLGPADSALGMRDRVLQKGSDMWGEAANRVSHAANALMGGDGQRPAAQPEKSASV
jgi:hypothetical protein